MSYKNFKIVRLLLAFFIAITVSIAVSIENFYLAISAVIIGIILMLLIKKRVKVLLVDEMVRDIAGKSALMAYSIIVPILAILSLFFMFFNLDNQNSYLYNLGVIFSYIALLNIAIYSIAYYYYRKKNGSDEE
ncbi:MAG: DUF2178 domain-containing protein [Candidatus Paceibacterota bacterium]|jgi:uncharacterized membrane protein